MSKKKIIKGSGILKQKAGRNNTGKITVYQKGAGNKRKKKYITPINSKIFANTNNKGIVEKILYDPNRNASLRLINWKNKEEITNNYQLHLNIKNTTLQQEILKIDDIKTLKIEKNKMYQTGNFLKLKDLIPGTIISNINNTIAKAAETYCQILQHDNYNKLVKVKLPSGEEKWMNSNYIAILGIIEKGKKKTKKAKAGTNRWFNKRPKVRGVAMNPIDHPHGGGEGKTSGGKPSKTPWGKPTK